MLGRLTANVGLVQSHVAAVIPKWNALAMDPLNGGLEPMPSRELAAFVAAVETRGIGAAADLLSLTQSAVSKRIKNLERRLGAVLLERSHGGVRLTAAGSAIYPDAKDALLALSRAAQTLRDERDVGAQRLMLAASSTIGTCLLPRWLAEFRTARPSVRPQVSVSNCQSVLAAVHAHEVELGFVPFTDSLDGFDMLTVGHDELVVVVGASHRWAHTDSVVPSQLSREPFVTREDGSGTRASSVEAVRRLGVELQPELAMSSIDALKRVILDRGFTIMSSLAISDERSTGQLRALRLDGVSLPRELLAIKRRDGQLGPAALQFWAWLAAERTAVPAAARRSHCAQPS
jgi:DNA-binding transcriptional LysR family regulator